MSQTSDNNKRIAKNTAMLYVRMLITMVVGIYTSRVILDALGEVDYGIYNVVGGFVTVFSIVSGTMTTATQRFLSFEIGKNNSESIQKVFSSAVIIHYLLAFITLVMAEAVGVWFLNTHMNFPADRYVAANWVFQISLLTFLITIVSQPYNAALIAYERMSAFAYLSIFDVAMKLGICYLIYISPIDKLVLYAILMGLTQVILRLIYGLYVKRELPACKTSWKIDKPICKSMFSFVGWNMIGALAVIAREQGVNVILNIFFGPVVNAARGIAYQILSKVQGFVGNFQMAFTPQIVKFYAQNDRQNMYKLVFRSSKFSYLLMLGLSVPIIIEAPAILGVWLKDVPEDTALFTRIVLFTSMLSALSNPLISAMHASGIVRDYQIIVGGISLLTLPFVYVFLKFGAPAYMAMLVVMVFEFICHIARVILLGRTIQFPIGNYFLKVTIRMLLITLVVFLAPCIIYYAIDVPLWRFCIVVVVSILSFAIWSYYLGLDSHERTIVGEKIKSVIQKVKH